MSDDAETHSIQYNTTITRLVKDNEWLRGELERVTDLVRDQRVELHKADLITDEEYARLADIKGSPARLESYDTLRAERDRLEASVNYWQKVAEEAVTRLQSAEAKVAQLENALQDVKQDCEICDWSCERCGKDRKMTDCDIYLTVTRALSSTPPPMVPLDPHRVARLAWQNGIVSCRENMEALAVLIREENTGNAEVVPLSDVETLVKRAANASSAMKQVVLLANINDEVRQVLMLAGSELGKALATFRATHGTEGRGA